MEFTDITCPVCGLACDDLRVSVDDTGARLDGAACPASRAYFAAAWPGDADAVTPRLRGEKASAADAVSRAAQLLAASVNPLVSGLAADVEGARAALALADRFGATVDHRDSDALFRNLRVVQDCGWFTTTLSEVRNRADLVVVVGEKVFEQFPRFAERVLAPDGLFVSGRRKLVLIGPWRKETLPAELSGVDLGLIPLPLASVTDAAGVLRMLVRGDTPRNGGELPVDALSRLASALNEAAYSVIAWSSADLDFAHAELAVEALSELSRDLNRRTRCGALPLGGGHGGMSASQVCTWQSGVPLRSSFATGQPQHDSFRYAGSRMLDAGETDLLVWLATLLPDPVPDTRCPTIVIGHPGCTFKKPPEVFIPAGIPGIDHAGHCFRTDTVVTLPLRRLRETRWPPLREIVDQLLEARC